MTSRAGARFLMVMVFTFMLAMPIVSFLGPSKAASAYSGIDVYFYKPSFAGVLEVVPVKVTMHGGPAGDIGGNYSYKDVTMTGANTTGWMVDKLSQTSESGVFRFNITMPAEPGQTVRVKLNATSTEWKDGKSTYNVVEFEMKVVDPIVITAEVFNRGLVDAVNATVRIYADGVLLNTKVINVTAGSSTTVTHNWTFDGIRSGKHVVTVTIDDPSGIVEFSDGNNEYTLAIYVGEQSNPAGAVLTVGLIIVIILFVLTYLQKPMKRGKKL